MWIENAFISKSLFLLFVSIKKWLVLAHGVQWVFRSEQTRFVWNRKKNHAPLPNEAWKLHSTDRATACHLKMKLKRAGVLTRSPCNQFWVWTLNKAQWMRIITIRIDTIQLHLYPSNCDDLVPIPNIIWIMIKCHAPSLNLVHLTQEFWLIIVMWLMDKANKNYA